jgi:serine/threonine protein kinase
MSDQNPIAEGAAAAKTGILTDPVDNFRCPACGASIHVTGLPAFSAVNCQACSAETTVPVKLGNFLLMRLIGTGGMGGVYFARDEQLGRDVAIKVMLQSLGEDPQFIETFRHEAQAVAKLNHTNIAQIYSFGQEKGQPYIVMELVSGERVDDIMERPNGIPAALAMRIGLEISQGLSAADEAGLVHGDIKPENILLDKKGRAKLVDFGLATVAHQNAGEGIWGTPYYIAPEKIRRQKLDARSDIYSLGATLYHMLTGRPPFEGETPVEVVKVRLDAIPPDPRIVRPELPPIITEIITRMLAVERTERYPNYRSLISDLRKALQAFDTAHTTTAPALPAGKSIRINKRRSVDGVGSPAPSAAVKQDAPAVNSKRLTIHKAGAAPRSNITLPGQAAGGAIANQRGVLSDAELQERREKARARQRRATTITLTIVLIVGSLVGGFVWWHLRNIRKEEMRLKYELSRTKEAAFQILGDLTTHHARLERFLADVQPLTKFTRETAERMQVPIQIVTPAPIVPQPQPVPAAAAGDAVEATTPVPEADAGAPAEEAPAPEPVPATTTASTPEGKLVHDILSKEREIEGLIASAKTRLQNATDQQGQIARTDVLLAASAGQAALREMLNESNEGLATAQRLTREMGEASGTLRQIRERFEADEQRRLAAELAAQRVEEARLAQERILQEEEQRAQQEIQRIISLEQQVQTLLDENAFEHAHTQIRGHATSFLTEKGKEQFRISVERYRFLAAMKTNLTRAMLLAPFTWGWGTGTAARDITGASERGIHVQGFRGPVPWKEVPPAQMMKIIDNYIDSRDLSARDRVEIAFGAALYADLFGANYRSHSRRYATRALDMGLNRGVFENVLEARWNRSP